MVKGKKIQLYTFKLAHGFEVTMSDLMILMSQGQKLFRGFTMYMDYDMIVTKRRGFTSKNTIE